MSEFTSEHWNTLNGIIPSFRQRFEETIRHFRPARSWHGPQHSDACHIARQMVPETPVLSFSRAELERRAKLFLDDFPGQVTYAVKANSALPVLQTLSEAGISGFDAASLSEIQAVRRIQPDAEIHYHNPVKSKREIETAYHVYGVRHFALDHDAEFAKLAALTAPQETTLAVRFRLDEAQSAHDFTSKFGLNPQGAIALLRKVAAAGYSVALTFHPGSQCYAPSAYSRHIEVAAEIAHKAGVELVCLNVGGGFPTQYPHENLPPLQTFFDEIRTTTLKAFGANAPLICCEPGRALVATCMSLLVQIKLVRDDQNDIFLTDGMYGGFLEPTQIPVTPPVRLIRDGEVIDNEPTKQVTAYGPTCDPIDTLPTPLALPGSVQEGDFLEFGLMGAYSTATATGFNGYGQIELMAVDQVFQG